MTRRAGWVMRSKTRRVAGLAVGAWKRDDAGDDVGDTQDRCRSALRQRQRRTEQVLATRQAHADDTP